MRFTSLGAGMIATFLVAAAPAAAFAADLDVPRQYPTLDAALEAARKGDRIVVRGGRHSDVVVKKSDVTLVGRGATLARRVYVPGSRVTIQGFRIASTREDGGTLEIEGDDVAVRDCAFRYMAVMSEIGARTTIERNVSLYGGLIALGDHAVVRANRVVGADIYVRDGGIAESNVGTRDSMIWVDGPGCVVRGNRADFARVFGDGCELEGNVLKLGLEVMGDRAAVRDNVLRIAGITVYGDDASVVGNTVRHGTFGVHVDGNGAEITDNDLNVGFANPLRDLSIAAFPNCPGIQVTSTLPGCTIARNRVRHTRGTGIVVSVDGATVEDNVVRGVSSMSSIVVTGSTNTLAGNDVVHVGSAVNSGNGIDVTGDGNVVRDNHVVATAADGIVVQGGAGNSIVDDVLERAGECGILVTADAGGTVVSGCTVTKCPLGLVNVGWDSSVADSTLVSNGWADLLDLDAAGARLLDGNSIGDVSHDALLLAR